MLPNDIYILEAKEVEEEFHARFAAILKIYEYKFTFKNCPVAYACSKVPGLRELAEAVTFSRSLTDAVNNQYVQPISLTQTQNGITASVDYLIVDQKQVNVFYRLTADVPPLSRRRYRRDPSRNTTSCRRHSESPFFSGYRSPAASP